MSFARIFVMICNVKCRSQRKYFPPGEKGDLILAFLILHREMRCVLKRQRGVSLPRMTFAKKFLIMWCLETQGANSQLFSTWWMRSPLCSLNHICSCLTERKCGPCPFSARLSHGNGCSMSSLSVSLFCTPKHTNSPSAVGKGQGRSPQRRMLTSENSFSPALGLYTSFGETTNKKARGPLARSFLSLFISRHGAQSY